jgi:multidrug efflux pump subunit AcrB
MVISDLAVKKRVTVYVLAAVLTIMGLVSYLSLPLESAPDISIPNVFVQTFYRGVSPEDIEKSITIELEKKLKGLEGVKKITSISSEGVSSINIEFVTGTDIDDAIIKVKDKIDLAKKDLPSDLDDDPIAFEVNFSEMPILVISLSGKGGMRQLTKIAEDLEEDIEAVKGVLEVDIAGGVTREIQIQVDPQRMALYNIPFTQLQAVVGGENANVSGGSISTGEGRYQLRAPGEFKTVEEVESIVVAMVGDSPVYLRDLATVVDGIKDRESYARTNGRDSVSLYIKKRTGENVVKIVEKVDAAIDEAKKSWPASVEIIRVSDRAKEIHQMVADLENNILTGLVLVVIVVCTAMGFRNAILVSLSIPLSMLISFIVLLLLGITLNMVVLFSLTLALGMLVDNAIVIIENIYRFMQQGVSRLEAAKRATSEVAWPIIGSSLTTICAFFPLMFWPGVMGEFMSYLPKTVIITLASCLFVALVINPALAAALMKVEHNGEPVSAEDVMSGGEHPMLEGGGRIIDTYRRVLRTALRFRLAVVAFGGVVMVAMMLLWVLLVGLKTPTELFPSIDPMTAWINIDPPEGADLEYLDAIVKQCSGRVFLGDENIRPGEKIDYGAALKPREKTNFNTGEKYSVCTDLPAVKFVYEKSSIGNASGGFQMEGGSDNQVAVNFLDFADRVDGQGREISSRSVIEKIDRLVKGVPGGDITVEEAQEGPPTGAPINIEISGNDFPVLGEISEQVKKLLAQVPHTRNITSDFEGGAPTLNIKVNRKRAGLLGLTTDAIGFAIKAAINGIEVSTYREQDDDYDIMVRFLEADRKQIDTLRRIFLPSPKVGLVPLTTVAEIAYVGGVGRISRINYQRVVTVKADVDEAMTTGITARLATEKLMKDFPLPGGYHYEFTGENEEQQESTDFLFKALGVALMLIFLVLVGQFNSISMPLVIMSAVMLSLAGVFLGLAVYQMPFGIIMTGVGVISLAGVVVNNAIVLVDYTEQLMERGLKRDDAIVAAGATRLRPVLLTAITTVLGLVPMVTGVSYDFHNFSIQWMSESSQWWKSMAVAVIFGLGLATLLTLIVVPVLFSLVDSLRRYAITTYRWTGCATACLWWSRFDARHGTAYSLKWRKPFAEIMMRVVDELQKSED